MTGTVMPGINRQGPKAQRRVPQAETGKWLEDVLNNTMIATAQLNVPSAGTHTLCVYMVDPGVVIDRLVLDMGGLKSSYRGPHETRKQP